MKDLNNAMEDGLSSFYLISIIKFFTMAYKTCETELHKGFQIILLLALKQYI